MAFDLVLCALILAVALAAIGGRGAFLAVVFFIVYGVLIALAWLRLGAPDVALAEAAIGAGLTGVLLLGAAARLQRLAPEDADFGALNAPAALATSTVAGALSWAVLTLPRGVGLQPDVVEALPRSGVDNPVTAVLLNFRAWDTLLESIVLLAAWSRSGRWRATRPGAVRRG
jgi:uncharacterized MnhB-related membrane protein